MLCCDLVGVVAWGGVGDCGEVGGSFVGMVWTLPDTSLSVICYYWDWTFLLLVACESC